MEQVQTCRTRDGRHEPDAATVFLYSIEVEFFLKLWLFFFIVSPSLLLVLLYF